jgi:hypothetical protein
MFGACPMSPCRMTLRGFAVRTQLRAVVEAKDAEIAVLRAEGDAARERERWLELRLAELERRLGMDSSDSVNGHLTP